MITYPWFGPALIAVTIGMVILFISTMGPMLRGAQYVPTPRDLARRMVALAAVRPGEVVYDLGSGDGRLLFIAAQEFGARAVGVEIDPIRYAWTVLWIRLLRRDDTISIHRADLFDVDLRDADVVMLYLLPGTNARLLPKLLAELKPSARVVCHHYGIPGLTLQKEDGKLKLYTR